MSLNSISFFVTKVEKLYLILSKFETIAKIEIGNYQNWQTLEKNICKCLQNKIQFFIKVLTKILKIFC